MNKLKEFFELVGVQPERKFKLRQVSDGHWLANVHWFMEDGNLMAEGSNKSYFIPEILSGKYEIVLEPFKPTLHQKYWFISPTSGVIYDATFDPTCSDDLNHIATGNCFYSENIPDNEYNKIKNLFEEAGSNTKMWKIRVKIK